MNKTTRILLLAILGLSIPGYFIYKNQSIKETVQTSGRDFQIENIGQIDRIFVSKKSGQSYLLKKINKKWFLEDNTPANLGFVEPLLRTLSKLEMKNLVPKKAIPNVMKDIATKGLKVEIYAGNKVLQSFYIGDSNLDISATYMVKDGSNIPYEMGVRNFDGDMRPIFWPVDLIDLRTNVILDYKPGELQHVKLDYPRNSSESFTLSIKSKTDFDLKPLHPLTRSKSGIPKKGEVESFLIGFENLLAASVLQKSALLTDSVNISEIPFLQMSLIDIHNRTSKLVFYPIIDNTINAGKIINLDNRPFQYFIIKDDSSFYTGQDKVINKVFWGYSFFY